MGLFVLCPTMHPSAPRLPTDIFDRLPVAKLVKALAF